MLMTMMHPEELDRCFSKIVTAKRTILQDGCIDEGPNDPAERNEKPPD